MTTIERRKKFGQVFTPPTLAALMADWVMETHPRTVLDPAFGNGALATACLRIDPTVQVLGYEIDHQVIEETPTQTLGASDIKLEDFIDSETCPMVEAIIANPPYIRHRELKNHLHKRDRLSGYRVVIFRNRPIYT